MVERLRQMLGSGLFARCRAYAAPVAVGLAIWVGFPGVTINQNISAGPGQDIVQGAAIWNGSISRQTPDSVSSVDLPFRDGVTTGSIAEPQVGAAKRKARTPDEDRILRATKKGRLVNVAPVAPPRAFTAGSIFQRTSSLFKSTLDTGQKFAFVRSDIRGQEVQIAAAFHAADEGKREDVTPAYLTALINNDDADVLATAYAPPAPNYAKASPFASLLNEGPAVTRGRFIPPQGKGDHAWIKNPLPASVFSGKEQACLANAVYFEARGESAQGQAAVAQVILNRVRNPAYPNSICDVVYQNDQWMNACQFSFACDGIKDRVNSPGHYRKAQEIAMAVTAGKIFLPEVGSSTHYYAQYVSPFWAKSMHRMTKIGLHIFYRTKRGGWS